MTMQAAGVGVTYTTTTPTAALVRSDTVVNMVVTASGGDATDIPLDGVLLVNSKSEWDDIGVTGGTAFRQVAAIYARGVEPRLQLTRVPDISASGVTVVTPTLAQVEAAVVRLQNARNTTGYTGDIFAAPGLTWNRRPSADGTNAGDPVTTAAANGVVTALQAAATAAEGIAIAETPIVGSGVSAQVTYMNAHADANHGDRVVMLAGMNKVSDTDIRSVVGNYIGELVYLDGTEQGRHTNPMMQTIQGITELDPVIAYGRDSDSAGLLSANNVTTFIRDNGWHIWGNTFNGTASGQLRFINVLRMRDLIARNIRTIARGYLRGLSLNVYFNVVNNHANAYLNSLAASGQIVSGTCRSHPTKNTQTNLDNGVAYFALSVDLAPGLRRIEFDIEVS